MATTLSTFSVKFAADTASFNNKLAAAQARTQKFNAVMGKIGSGLKKFAVAGAAGAAAITAIGVAMTKKGLVDVDRISKLSDELGIATEWLGTYEYAANLTGVANATVEKGLQKLVRRLGEAKQGHGEAVKGFNALGISASALVNLKTEDALAIIADKIKALPNAAEKAATAFAIFGRQGIELLNFLNLGSAGLATMREEADSLGLTFSREMGAKVEMANDAIFRLTSLSTVLSRVLAIELAPYITAIATKLSNASAESGGFGKNATKAIGRIIKVLAKMSDYWSLVRAAYHTFIAAVAGGMQLAITPIWALLKVLGKVADFLGMDNANAMLDAASQMAEIPGEIAVESAKKAASAAKDFWNQTASKDAASWMKQVNKEADKQAKIIAASSKQRAALKKAGAEFLKQKEKENKISKVIADREKKQSDTLKKIKTVTTSAVSTTSHKNDYQSSNPMSQWGSTGHWLNMNRRWAEKRTGKKPLDLQRQMLAQQKTGNQHLKQIATNTKGSWSLT